MAADCISKAQSDAAYGDKGIAMKNSVRYDGDGGQDKKFEGEAPAKSDSAQLVQYTGRQ